MYIVMLRAVSGVTLSVVLCHNLNIVAVLPCLITCMGLYLTALPYNRLC